MKYNFAFYTGYGYREISAHTIKAYYVPVNAENDQEAIKKLIKKKGTLSRFNECFRNENCGVEIQKEERVGSVFINEGIIKWQDEEVYTGPQAYPCYVLHKRKIQPTKYIFSGEWVLFNVLANIYPSYTSFLNHMWDRFGGNNDKSFLLHKREDELNNYYYKSIKSILSSDKITPEERQEIQPFLERKYTPKEK